MADKLTVEDLDNLRHMLGATPPANAASIGYRNHFYIDKNDPSMLRLEEHGFVKRGSAGLGAEGEIYFHATRDGCKAAGVTAKQIARALKD